MGLGYPGGAVLEELARSGQGNGINFPRSYLGEDSLDFSFSGLKTAVAIYLDKWRKDKEAHAGVKEEDIAASFQEAVVDVLAQRLIKAGEKTGVESIVLAGGVACNAALRRRLKEDADIRGIGLYCPRPDYCTDNGAMIALTGYYRIMRGERSDLSIDVRSRYPIEDIAVNKE
jgi:N6-L-threonylcarbamoyladenine synthase